MHNANCNMRIQVVLDAGTQEGLGSADTAYSSLATSGKDWAFTGVQVDLVYVCCSKAAILAVCMYR